MTSLQKKRILLIAPALGPIGSGENGGVERRIRDMIRALGKRRYHITVMALPGSTGIDATIITVAGTPPFDATKISRQTEPMYPSGNAVVAMWEAARLVQNRFDCIIGLQYDIPAYQASVHFTTPVGHIVTVGSQNHSIDRALRAAYRRSPDQIAFLSKSQAASYPQVTHPTIFPIGTTVDTAIFRPSLNPQRRLIWAARIYREKGLHIATAVAHRLALPLDICGRKQDPEYFMQCVEPYPQLQWSYHGFLPDRAFAQVIGSASVMLAPYLSPEGIPGTVMASLACGTPVVGTPAGGISDVITPSVGRLVSMDAEVPTFVRAVREAMQLDRQHIPAAIKRYSLEAFADSLEHWIEILIGESKNKA
ncbi:MAG: glycosyltransferase [Candidatus Kerfeldbacteria bacterium]|nr:glycosyltransferase [Candidatus Kerfeldbacteria bacterium]